VTLAAISVMYAPPYPFSGAGSPFAAATRDATNRSIWPPASLK
jgi:hypothetical protein